MKFFRLLSKNILRNLMRTFLTVAGIAIAIFVVATLMTVLHQLQNPPETPEGSLRLITRHHVSLMNILPVAYRQKISQLEGVEGVVGQMWFGGYYKDPKNFFANFSTQVEDLFTVYSDLQVPEEEKQEFLKDRTGALVGRRLAEQFEWEVGDRVHLISPLWVQFKPELTIRAIYDAGPDDGQSLYFHWEYFNEGMGRSNFVGTYSIRADDPERVPQLAEQVDDLFRNSNAPTKTETEKAFSLSFVSMIGNVQLFISSICAAVIFAIVLAVATAMAMSIRERTREIAIFRALGFKKRVILSMLLSESVALSAGGAVLGAVLAALLFRGVNTSMISAGFLPELRISLATIGLCAAIGVAIGFLSAGVPAWRASRTPVAEALRKIV